MEWLVLALVVLGVLLTVLRRASDVRRPQEEARRSDVLTPVPRRFPEWTLPDCTAWNALSAVEKVALGREIAARLGPPLVFEGVTAPGDLARFRLGSVELVFVPGGQTTLGVELAVWPELKRRWPADAPPLEEWARRWLRPVRSVCVPPLLVGVHAEEIGPQPVDAADPVVAKLRAQVRGLGTMEAWTPHGRYRLIAGANGERVFRVVDISFEAVVNELRAHGFDLPTPDEWEHLCAAGERALFRWGPVCPLDRYPCDDAPESADGERHRQPNGWGLVMPSTAYELELTLDPDVRLGSDGGGATCGGEGFPLAWLSLASAFRGIEGGASATGCSVRRIMRL